MTSNQHQSKPNSGNSTTWTLGRTIQHREVRVVDLAQSDGQGMTGQLSNLPDADGPGFLIRVWPTGATYEQGGTGGGALSLVVKEVDGKVSIDSLHTWGT